MWNIFIKDILYINWNSKTIVCCSIRLNIIISAMFFQRFYAFQNTRLLLDIFSTVFQIRSNIFLNMCFVVDTRLCVANIQNEFLFSGQKEKTLCVYILNRSFFSRCEEGREGKPITPSISTPPRNIRYTFTFIYTYKEEFTLCVREKPQRRGGIYTV